MNIVLRPCPDIPTALCIQNAFDQLQEAFEKLAASNANLVEDRQISQLLHQLNCQPKVKKIKQIMFEAALWNNTVNVFQVTPAI